jgi:hypothetical protein
MGMVMARRYAPWIVGALWVVLIAYIVIAMVMNTTTN